MELCTAPSENSTVICADEPGPAVPRTFPPAPGWPPGGHRVKAPPGYSRGRDKARAYDGLRVKDGQAITLCAPSRNSEHYQRFLQQAEDANPGGQIVIITDNLSSHDSKSTRAWLERHPRVRHAFIPKRACCWRLPEIPQTCSLKFPTLGDTPPWSFVAGAAPPDASGCHGPAARGELTVNAHTGGVSGSERPAQQGMVGVGDRPAPEAGP